MLSRVPTSGFCLPCKPIPKCCVLLYANNVLCGGRVLPKIYIKNELHATFGTRTHSAGKTEPFKELGIDPYPAALYPCGPYFKTNQAAFWGRKTGNHCWPIDVPPHSGPASLQSCRMRKDAFMYFNRDEICPERIKPTTTKYIKIAGYWRLYWCWRRSIYHQAWKTVKVKGFTLLSKSLKPFPSQNRPWRECARRVQRSRNALPPALCRFAVNPHVGNFS